MSQVISAGLPSPGPPRDSDPFRYGWRYVTCTTPDGRKVIERVPLTLEDVLHPQEDDVIPQKPIHEADCRYLANVLEARYARDPHVQILAECLVDWGISGLKPPSPDIVILEGVQTKEHLRDLPGTFRLRERGGHPLLVIEIVSPQTRENDLQSKLQEYHLAGVPLYFLVDWEREEEPRRLLAYRQGPRGYVAVSLDPVGRVSLGPTGILLGLKDEHVVCYDQATGKELGNYAQVCEQLEQEAAARQAAEQRQREEAAARQVAEQRQREAEQRQREEAAARQAAEQRAQAAEARLRELEEQFQRYNERSS